jgi:hypothetical protein
MINTLKNKALENQMVISGGTPHPTPQPMPQQAPFNPQTMPNNYPQMQAIEGMQKRKAELEKQYSNMNPNKSMLGGAAQAVMNTPAGESPMAVLARGLMGANQGLKAHGMEQNENLRQQAEIDQTISNTYQFIKDYDYNRAIKREELGMKHRELDLKEMDILGKQAKYAHEGAKMGLEQQKFVHEQTKDTTKDYNYKRKVLNKMIQIQDALTGLDTWGPVEGKFLKGDPLSIGLVGKNKIEDMQLVNKYVNELVYYISENNSGKGSDQLRRLVKDGKVDLSLGYKGMTKILSENIQEYSKEVARDEFALEKVEKGVPIHVGLRTFDKYLENPRVFKTPDNVLNYYQQHGKMPTYAEMLELRDAEKRENQAQNNEGVEKQSSGQQKNLVNNRPNEEEDNVYKDADDLAIKILGVGK